MKRAAFFFATFLLLAPLAAQTTINTAALTAKEAAKKGSLDDVVSYLKKQIPLLTVAAEKRAVYAFLGSVQEQMGAFADAEKSYVAAAAIAAGDAAGMPKKSNEQLVIDAVRCALSCGDSASANSYLNSSVRNTKNPTVLAYVKLYAQWSALCAASSDADLAEPVAMLKTYATLSSMQPVAPSVLLTLWHITGEDSYAQTLKKDFATSPEAAIVKGTIQQLPVPFWFFVRRTGSAIPDVDQELGVLPPEEKSAADTKSANASAERENTERAKKQQLGLFRDENNAKGLVEQLKKKGFAANITSETRPSGTTYYLVVVDENKAGTMGTELRNAGFECYPVFE